MSRSKTLAYRFSPFGCGLVSALCVSLAVVTATAFAQDKPAAHPATTPAAPASAAAAAPKPPDVSKEALVFDKLITRIREEADGTGTRQTTARVRVLADAGVKEMAVLAFTFIASNQRLDIGYVRVIKPDGSVVVTPEYNVLDLPAPITQSAPMYSDIHQKHVTVKGLGVGDTLEYDVTLHTLKPEVPGQFWFDYDFEKNIIVLDEQLDLDVPADKAVTVASASADLQPTITTAAGRKLYHWAGSNLVRPDPDAPPKSTKHIKPSVQVTTFSSWEQVGAWYGPLVQGSLVVTPAIQAKADALTKGLTSDDDKINAIFNDVALHIHYVGLEFGIGRYQPHPADDVLSNEYGDCKDKHTLLAALLKAAGIEAWPVLISSERELDPATPSPAQFNHLITVVPRGGKLLWMDSTEEVAPVGVIMAILRDKQALAIPTSKPAYLERTPAELPYPQKAAFHAEGKLSDQGKFTGHITQSYHGDSELFLRLVFRQVPPSQLKEALQRFSSGMGFGGEISNPQLSDVEQTSKPVEISYDYTREKFGEWDAHRIFPALPSTGVGLGPGIKEKKPADDVDLGSPGVLVYSSSIELPKGYGLVAQKNVSLKEDWVEYSSTYSFKDGIFTAERRLTIKKTKVPLSDWDKYLDFRRAIYADEVETTVLYGGSWQGAGGPAYRAINPPARMDPELQSQFVAALQPMRDAGTLVDEEKEISAEDRTKAATLARSGVDAIEQVSQKLPTDEISTLYSAQALSAAWSELGWCALQNNDLATAENYLHAAWHLSQDRLSGYRLGRLLEAKGQKAAAAHQYELASISSVPSGLGGLAFPDADILKQIGERYKLVAGHELTATPLKQGSYNGSLREELDKLNEIHPLIAKSKVNGSGYFLLAFQASKPVKVSLIGGDKAVSSLSVTLQNHAFPSVLPAGSKAVLLREVHLICSEWAGCDADIELPTAIKTQPIEIKPEDHGKSIQLQLEPPPKTK
jgi:hypothetical protein